MSEKIFFELHWIPLLPFIGAAFCLLIGRKFSRQTVHWVASGAVFLAFLVALKAVFGSLWPEVMERGDEARALGQQVFDWISIGSISIPLGLVCDQLTAVMILVITGIGFLIHIYSTGYMSHEKDYARFFGYLNLFCGSMLLLVLGDSLVVLFVGWEGVGVCSYLLIGFWYDKSGTDSLGDENASAGKKAFVVNRVGDLAFILGMFVLFAATGTLNIEALANPELHGELLRSWTPLGIGALTTTVVGGATLLLFLGATGKSAQIPLFVWLPDAMAGPTPVSALIHAATMVTAGVYMISRLNFLYMLSPGVMGIVALVGALTALFAATIGIFQNDIKKVLAYSTVSQLGYMFMAVGVGAFSAGMFHVFTHAFFKACLFLGAGAVIHALHGDQDMRNMGGLRKYMPVTWITMLVSTLAIAGIVPFAGFFSKDEVLWKVFHSQNPAWPDGFSFVLYAIGMAAALCTAFYMFRLYFLTFSGTPRASKKTMEHLHLPSLGMKIALSVLGLGAAVLGFLGLPGKHNLFHHWLGPVVDAGRDAVAKIPQFTSVAPNEALAHNHGLEFGLMGLSLAIAITGILIAKKFYSTGPAPEPANKTFVRRMLENKYWVDEIYLVGIVRTLKVHLSNFVLFKFVDRFIIDGLLVNGSAFVVDTIGRILRMFHSGNVQRYLAALVIGAGGLVLYAYACSDKISAEFVSGKHSSDIVAKLSVRDGVVRDSNGYQFRWDVDNDGKWDTSWTGQSSHDYRLTSVDKKNGVISVRVEVKDVKWDTTSVYSKTIKLSAEEKQTLLSRR